MPESAAIAFRIKELARRWRTRPETVRAMIRRGELAAFKINGRMRVSPEAVIAAERGRLAVRPALKQRRERVPAEVARLLSD